MQPYEAVFNYLSAIETVEGFPDMKMGFRQQRNIVVAFNPLPMLVSCFHCYQIAFFVTIFNNTVDDNRTAESVISERYTSFVDSTIHVLSMRFHYHQRASFYLITQIANTKLTVTEYQLLFWFALTCTELMQINGGIISLRVSSVPCVRYRIRSTPNGLRIAAVSSIDSLKTSRAMRLRPMPNHWLPIPE